MRFSFFVSLILALLLLVAIAAHGQDAEKPTDAALRKQIEKFLKLRRKIAEHELAPEKKDVKKIQQLQQTMTTVKDELIKAGVDVNAVAIQDDSRLKNKEMRVKLKAEERTLDTEFYKAWTQKLADKGLLDHCTDKTAPTCIPLDPEDNADVSTMEARLEARVKKLQLRLEEAQYKLEWVKERNAKAAQAKQEL